MNDPRASVVDEMLTWPANAADEFRQHIVGLWLKNLDEADRDAGWVRVNVGAVFGTADWLDAGKVATLIRLGDSRCRCQPEPCADPDCLPCDRQGAR